MTNTTPQKKRVSAKTKVVAGLGAVALLGAAAGSMAYFNDVYETDTDVIQSGSLSIDEYAAAVWEHRDSNDVGTVVPNAAAAVIIPGDTLEREQSVKVTSTGANMLAESQFTWTSEDIDPGFAAYLDSITTVEYSLVNGDATETSPGVWQIDGPGEVTFHSVVTVEFPFGEAVDNQWQSHSASVEGDFTVVQLPLPTLP